ncbi:sensor histidine kinase [Actinomadura scrupuli]|uniref:sensor histidine kinase n=1 Tax=Actinomadura scrupuli TaxID=559629 RepID=UPI003D986D62
MMIRPSPGPNPLPRPGPGPRTLARRLRPTIRVRLTLLYGGLFLAAGLVLLAVIYALVAQDPQGQSVTIRGSAAQGVTFGPGPSGAAGAKEAQPPGPAEFTNSVRDTRQAMLNSLLTRGGIALGLVGVVTAGLGWLMADRALRPVHQVTETARRVAQGHNLSERIGYDGPGDDVKELADSFDTMLARLERAFDGQRRFVANASHELRTPLAINRTLVDVAVRRPDATDEVLRLGESLLVVNARHERLIDGLLTLAGSENAITDPTPVDLCDVAGHVLDQVEAAEGRLTVHRLLAPAPTRGDPVLLERLVQNLVENAVRHNLPEHGEIWLTTGRSPDLVELRVANTGPVVPPYDVETIFEPFRRLRSQRVDSDRGSGLGLSIVRAIATAHGGTVHAEPHAGGGLTLVVRMPPSP